MTSDTRGPLTGPERDWLDARRRDAQREADQRAADRRRLPGRARSAADRWSTEAGWVALGLTKATATIPPPARRSTGSRAEGGDIPDPTSSIMQATVAAVAAAGWRYAHLASSCGHEGRPIGPSRIRHICPDGGATDTAELLDVALDDPTDMIAGLTDTPPTATRWTAAVARAAGWHTTAAATLFDGWVTAWRDGAEHELLDQALAALETTARRMAGLAGDLAGWSGRREPTCIVCGGRKPDDGKVCGRCRTAKWRRERDQEHNVE